MNDLLKFNNVNLDVLTETYNMPFYYHYLSRWPEAFVVAEGPNSNNDGSTAMMGYVLGKAEGEDKLWHGHVSAVTVAPSYRRLGLAKTLMDDFEQLCVNTYQAYFVDLFVRETNHLAQEMYEKFGYSTCKFKIWSYMVNGNNIANYCTQRSTSFSRRRNERGDACIID